MNDTPKKDNISLITLIGANLLPLIGVFYFNWDVRFIVLLYWAENLIAGFYNILKIAFVRENNSAFSPEKLFIIPFFCIHYGGFCAAHGFFLTAFFKLGSTSSPFPTGGADWWGPFVFIQMLFNVIAKVWASSPPEMIWALLGLFISHGVSFVENFILGGEYRNSTIKELMHQPYQRIMVMHIAIITAGVFVMKFNSPMPMLIILIFLKIVFDIFLHRRLHRKAKKKAAELKETSAPQTNGGTNGV
jgi:hypothetical protein